MKSLAVLVRAIGGLAADPAASIILALKERRRQLHAYQRDEAAH